MTAPARPLAAYATVTAAYWAFMLTDGALRMLVLLHFHTLGFSPVQLAYLFVFYEIAGVVTNLSAGWLAARFGLTRILYAGLALQITALLALAWLDPGWAVWASVAFVMAIQGVSGVAKDLSKMAAKSAVKCLAPPEGGSLFRWVATLTGSKNAVKGFGFFLGAFLLGVVGFEAATLGLAAMLAMVLGGIALMMPSGLAEGSKKAKFRSIFSIDPAINRLSAARLFLFGARDVWFVVGIPVYFYTVLSDGTLEGNRAAFFQIGAFMALWIIGYGAVQVFAPKLLRAQDKNDAEITRMARFWVGILAIIPAILAVTAIIANGPAPWLTLVLVIGLLVFGVVFALNSALHSYLILALSRSERIAMDVGFYYMSNAAGRLAGTLLSGVSFQLGGLPLCLFVASAMAFASWICSGLLVRLSR